MFCHVTLQIPHSIQFVDTFHSGSLKINPLFGHIPSRYPCSRWIHQYKEINISIKINRHNEVHKTLSSQFLLLDSCRGSFLVWGTSCTESPPVGGTGESWLQLWNLRQRSYRVLSAAGRKRRCTSAGLCVPYLFLQCLYCSIFALITFNKTLEQPSLVFVVNMPLVTQDLCAVGK